MNMLPNDHHPGPRCSCAECQRRYPEVSEPAQPTSKDQISAERLSDLIASCIFQSETGGHGNGYVAFLYDIACACMELQRRRASLEPRAHAGLDRLREAISDEDTTLALSLLNAFRASQPPRTIPGYTTDDDLLKIAYGYAAGSQFDRIAILKMLRHFEEVWRLGPAKGENHG